MQERLTIIADYWKMVFARFGLLLWGSLGVKALSIAAVLGFAMALSLKVLGWLSILPTDLPVVKAVIDNAWIQGISSIYAIGLIMVVALGALVYIPARIHKEQLDRIANLREENRGFGDRLTGADLKGIEIETIPPRPGETDYLHIQITNNSDKDVAFYGVWLSVRCMNTILEKVRQHSNYVSWSGGDDEALGMGKGRKLIPANGGIGFLNLVEILDDRLKFWTTAGPTEHSESGIYMLFLDVRGDIMNGNGKEKIRSHPVESIFLFLPNQPGPFQVLPADAILGRTRVQQERPQP